MLPPCVRLWFQITARDARGDAGENFPDDGLGVARDLAHRQIGTEEFHFGPLADFGAAGHIHHQLVHGHPPENGKPAAFDPHLPAVPGHLARVAVAIADAHGGDPGRAVGDKCAAIGHAVAGRQGAQQGDARLEGHDVLQLLLEAGQRGNPVEHQARPRQVATAVGVTEDASAVR